MDSIGKKILSAPAIAIAVIVAIACVVVLSASRLTGAGGGFGADGKSPISSSSSRAWDMQKTFREIYDLNNDRVVFISTEQTVQMPQNPFFNDPFFRDFFGMPRGQQQPRTQKRTGLGTGFVLTDDGYICTNAHVVSRMDRTGNIIGPLERVKVKVGDTTYDAIVVGADGRTDIALLKINPKTKLNPVYLGDSDTVRVGDWAVAIGNPFGLDKTFTVGVISAVARKDVGMMGGSQTHIQTDASINPGNSGGPLININGEVIGINRMIYSNSGGSLGIGFAIPINQAKAVLEDLKKFKKVKRGYIGVHIAPLTDEHVKELGLKNTEGARVDAVLNGGPSAKAGMRVGDVILSVDGTKVNSPGALIEIVEKMPIGKTLKIEVWRERGTVTLYITIQERS
ncbi:MAG TPA: trypsin-like peptidase domain-containing protein [Spirochaetota bacterium]|nr:trypsin-like peptidase domain-containing protein [Spirochaetota bacterium]HNT09846.1 trypsin-like peptidase domain-containing protein [Spirochaetota bacterium]